MTRNEFDIFDPGPSRAARVVVLLSSVGVAVIAPVIRPAAAAPPIAVTAAPVVQEEPAAPAAKTEPAPLQATASLSSWPNAPAVAPAENNLAAAPPADPDAFESVPLPRPRPNATIAAYLTVPLPRARPEIEGEISDAEQSAFEAQDRRQRGY